jgi:hypothetical protein
MLRTLPSGRDHRPALVVLSRTAPQIPTSCCLRNTGRKAHMVAHTSKLGLLAHRIDGLEPNIELLSGLSFGDWDNILQGGCRYQGR